MRPLFRCRAGARGTATGSSNPTSETRSWRRTMPAPNRLQAPPYCILHHITFYTMLHFPGGGQIVATHDDHAKKVKATPSGLGVGVLGGVAITCCARSSCNLQTVNPKPSTQNLAPKTFNPKTCTQNLQPKAFNPKPSTPNFQPKTLNPKLSTQNPTIQPPSTHPNPEP